jgi:hypothetical protein
MEFFAGGGQALGQFVEGGHGFFPWSADYKG